MFSWLHQQFIGQTLFLPSFKDQNRQNTQLQLPLDT